MIDARSKGLMMRGRNYGGALSPIRLKCSGFHTHLHRTVRQVNAVRKRPFSGDSVMAIVLDGNDRGDHFVILARKRQFGRHQRAKRGKSVIVRIRDQRMLRDDRFFILARRR